MPTTVRSEITVGIIANPASGRDIRRLTAKASVFPTAEKSNMVQRLLGPLGLLGVDRVLMMPDMTGIAAGVMRAVATHHASRLPPWPRVEFLDMSLEGDASDSAQAARMIQDAGAMLVVVLGGDGTHRVVAGACPGLPMATLSTGTNNVFPDLREATVTGLAAALFATGRVPADDALRSNKQLVVDVGGRREIALVDVCFTRLDHIGARAVWDPASIEELFVSFAEADAIGLSSIAAAVVPVGRAAAHGMRVRCGEAGRRVLAPIAPGILAEIGVIHAEPILPGIDHLLPPMRGSIALDGEREVELGERTPVRVSLESDGPLTLDVSATLTAARVAEFPRAVGRSFPNPAPTDPGRCQPVDQTTNQRRRQT